MIIAHHLIASGEIIGISPLLIKESESEHYRVLYQAYFILFFVHTRQNKIEIKSDLLFRENLEEKDLLKSKKLALEFERSYYKAFREISELHKEEVPEKHSDVWNNLNLELTEVLAKLSAFKTEKMQP